MGEMSAEEQFAYTRVTNLIRAYRVRGHQKASLDPLGINTGATLERDDPPELEKEFFGFTDADLDKVFHLGSAPSSYRTLVPENPSPTLREIIAKLESCYGENIGYQYMYIHDEAQKAWVRDRIEKVNKISFDADTKQAIMGELIKSDGFEQFLIRRYAAEKRFGLDGCEMLIPGINSMIDRASELGVTDTIIGMPHRGRLNTLVNVMKKPLEALLYEFSDHLEPGDEGQGDVKYHLGLSKDITTPSNNKMHLSLLANPSHLEAANPVVLGKVRAKQDQAGGVRSPVLPVLLHGDAAFAGQGVVFECFGLTHLPAYETGGTIHVVVNNQVGFTTDPRFSRSTDYCTDLGKMVDAPIVHVNADKVEDVIRVFQMAVEYRQEFGNDFIIDLVCYRRFGHNEADQPAFTQPLMYQTIKDHPPVIKQYSDELKAQGVIDDAWMVARTTEHDAASMESLERAQPGGGYNPSEVESEFKDSPWKNFGIGEENAYNKNTGVDLDVLTRVGEAMSTVPDDFNVHKALSGVLRRRGKALASGADLDWSMGEGLAFGSLLLEGNTVRLSGQDVERGTFSHRHHVLHDQNTDMRTWEPLSNLGDDQAPYYVHNSHLSEYAVLGFELGFSQHNPYSLVLWEAQFGDFANTAQCIIDQFITSGEEKWGKQTGLVMLLPHGYEGMGPEHSSCRIERFLQMASDDESVYDEDNGDFALKQVQDCNIQMCNVTTPANYFHLLRRQVHRDFRKPLVIATPKSLLRDPRARSTLDDMGPGTRFKRLIPEQDTSIYDGSSNENVKRLVLCSGKVYYDMIKLRDEQAIDDVAIARVEQISPFPFDLVHRHADEFPNAEVVWCQEEPKNQGSWAYVRRRIETALGKSENHVGARPRFVGRPASASTATGDKYGHIAEQNSLVEQAVLTDLQGSPRTEQVEM